MTLYYCERCDRITITWMRRPHDCCYACRGPRAFVLRGQDTNTLADLLQRQLEAMGSIRAEASRFNTLFERAVQRAHARELEKERSHPEHKSPRQRYAAHDRRRRRDGDSPA